MVRQLVVGNEAVCRTARKVLKTADDAGDDPTVDLMTQRLQTHEKYAWMLRRCWSERRSAARLRRPTAAPAEGIGHDPRWLMPRRPFRRSCGDLRLLPARNPAPSPGMPRATRRR